MQTEQFCRRVLSLAVRPGRIKSYGIEDCRVVQIGETYYLTFTEGPEHGVGVGLRSTDWRDILPHGMILTPTADCAIFGEQIGGKYYACTVPAVDPWRKLHLDRRIADPCIGGARCLAHSRRASGTAPASGRPIRTPGWLGSRRQWRTPPMPRR